MKSFLSAIPVLLLSGLLLASCSDDSSSPQTQTGRMIVYLTDAPADIEEVNVTFSEIAAHIDNEWIVVRGDPVTVNLLEWNNGKSIIIGDSRLGPGKYTQIRLMLDTAEIKVNGKISGLEIPSADKTGLKLNHPFEIAAGSTYELVVDFDVAESVSTTGPKDDPKSYKLKPTLRVVTKAVTGSISGTVSNPGNAPVAYAKDDQGNTVTSTFADPVTGEFVLSFLTEGTYSVFIEDEKGSSFTKQNVKVTAGQDTGIGTVSLQ